MKYKQPFKFIPCLNAASRYWSGRVWTNYSSRLGFFSVVLFGSMWIECRQIIALELKPQPTFFPSVDVPNSDIFFSLSVPTSSWESKHAISVQWLVKPNRAHSHLHLLIVLVIWIRLFIKVKIVMLITSSYKSSRLCWLFGLVWLADFEYVVLSLFNTCLFSVSS
jgi:hypothetical protein